MKKVFLTGVVVGLVGSLATAVWPRDEAAPCRELARACLAQQLAAWEGRGWIGARLGYMLRDVPGLEVLEATPGGPAAAAGLAAGDLVVALAGTALPSTPDPQAAEAAIAALFTGLRPGKPVSFKVRRGAIETEIEVTPVPIPRRALAEVIGLTLLAEHGARGPG